MSDIHAIHNEHTTQKTNWFVKAFRDFLVVVIFFPLSTLISIGTFDHYAATQASTFKQWALALVLIKALAMSFMGAAFSRAMVYLSEYGNKQKSWILHAIQLGSIIVGIAVAVVYVYYTFN